jgi:serine/threonine-protein kinase
VGLDAGSMLERYEIVRLVGRGGMGEVYHAIDTRLRRPVALKVLREDKDQSLETGNAGVARLMREAQAAAALNHPNSVAIFELGEAPMNGTAVHFIAMELITGSSFRDHAKNKQVSVATKLNWLIDAARALHAAHKVGIVHRDIKPANIMVSDEGTVKVLDFGLAKPADVTPGTPIHFQTKIGQVLGTPRYMAPEQIEGHTPDGRSDQFAFGLTAYELLSGEYAGGPLVIDPMPLDMIAPLVAPGLSKVIMRTLAFDKDRRYATMDEVANALKAVLPEVQAFRAYTTAPLPRAEATEKHLAPPVDPSLMPTRGPDSKPIGTLRMQTPPGAVQPVGPPTPLPMRTGPNERMSTLAMSRPITPMPIPSTPPISSRPSHSSSHAPRNPLSSSSGARSSQSFGSGQLPFPPQKTSAKGSGAVWVVAAVAVVAVALLGGGLLALFLR